MEEEEEEIEESKGIIPMDKKLTQTKGNGGGGREDCWSEGATGVLIDAWGQRYLELSRGNLKHKHWTEVADAVSLHANTPKTDIQCKNRIDTVKKKYKMEKAKIAAGGGPSKWVFFEKMDGLIAPSAVVGSSGKVPSRGAVDGSRQYRLEPVKLQFKGNVNDLQDVKVQGRKRGQETESDTEEEENFADSDDSLPPEKKMRSAVDRGVSLKESKGWSSSVRMLSQAILKFGEVYEHAESAKLQQVAEMEKARMKFAKDLELQRMQFLLKTQMEISQFKHDQRGAGGGSAGNLHSGNNNVSVKNDNSDSDN